LSIFAGFFGSSSVAGFFAGFLQTSQGLAQQRKMKASRASSLFVCWFCCYKTRKSLLRLPLGLGVSPLEYIHSDRVALPQAAVLLKVHHRPETLYVPTEVNTLQVDGLARIPGLTQALYKSHSQPPNSVQRSPTSDRSKR